MYESGRGDGFEEDEADISADIYYITMAIGVEYLLNAIVLQNDPSFFADKSDERRRSPSLSKLIGKVCSDLLPTELDNDQRNLIADTLQLIKVRRNNFAHLGYHSSLHSYHPQVIHYVLAYFVKTYFEDEELLLNLLYYADAENYIEGEYGGLTED